MRILRNIFRRKMRAFLTIFGITIGVFALVVMGGIAEKLQLLVDGGVKYYGDKVVVSEKVGNAYSTAPMSLTQVRKLEAVHGVARASAQLGMSLEETIPTVNFGPPPSIGASDGRERGYEKFVIGMKEGRDLQPGDRGTIVVGSDLVTKLHAFVGGTVKIRDERFLVVGIWNKTLTAPDNEVIMPLADAQRLYHASMPSAVAAGVSPKTLATSIVVYPEPGMDPERLVKLIEDKYPNFDATGPKEFQDQVVKSLATFNQIIYAIALVSLMVGGLSVINTMTMSVSERTREIGVRKAIGATNGAIMRQFVAESAVMGLIGGLSGLALGAFVAGAANAAGAASGTSLFLVSNRLAVGSVAFALVLGVVSGLYPAWHAASLNPVRALRYE